MCLAWERYRYLRHLGRLAKSSGKAQCNSYPVLQQHCAQGTAAWLPPVTAYWLPLGPLLASRLMPLLRTSKSSSHVGQVFPKPLALVLVFIFVSAVSDSWVLGLTAQNHLDGGQRGANLHEDDEVDDTLRGERSARRISVSLGDMMAVGAGVLTRPGYVSRDDDGANDEASTVLLTA